MREILLFMALLSKVTCEEIETEKHHPSLSADEPQFWLAKGSRNPWDLPHFELSQSLKDKDVRRHQEAESSLSQIPGSQNHDLNRRLFNNPLLSDTQKERQTSNTKLKQQSLYNEQKAFFLIPEFSKNGLNQERLSCTWENCRKIQGWSIQEPLYVDEPSWVQISSENFDNPLHKAEPFFVTRGKRAFQFENLNTFKNANDQSDPDSSLNVVDKVTFQNFERLNDEKIHEQKLNQELNKLKLRIPKDATKEGRVKIIQKRSEIESRKLLKNIEDSLINRDHIGGLIKTPSYLHPRNKHSDILEILEEPFFISRGKRNNQLALRDLRMEEFFMDQYLDNLLSTLEENENSSKRLLIEKIFQKIFNTEIRRRRNESENKNKSGYGAKRGILEELNLQADPFYVSRG